MATDPAEAFVPGDPARSRAILDAAASTLRTGEPADGPGWDRERIQVIIIEMAHSATVTDDPPIRPLPGDADQIKALLQDRDLAAAVVVTVSDRLRAALELEGRFNPIAELDRLTVARNQLSIVAKGAEEARNARMQERNEWRQRAAAALAERDDARGEAATLRAELARFKGDPDQVRAELAKAIEERDLAIAHDRQPYPTADAYERACAALERHRERADKAEAALARVRRVHFQYRTAWTDAFDTCAGCNRGMDLVPWPCPTIQALDGQQPPGGTDAD